MGVGWVDNVYNNSSSKYYIKSVDDHHNGTMDGGGANFALDGGDFHEIKPNTHYSCNWFGIPWYYQGKHYKAFKKDGENKTIKFYTSEIADKNWITYENAATGRGVVRHAAPKGSDFHANMRFEDNGVYIDIVNNNAFSGENAAAQVFEEYKGWVETAANLAGSLL